MAGEAGSRSARRNANSPAAPSIRSKEVAISLVALVGIALHLLLRFVVPVDAAPFGLPLAQLVLVVSTLSSLPLLIGLALNLARLEFGADLLAGISIVTSLLVGEYLAGTIVVLMLSSGQALEAYAVRRASFALEALARRLPTVAHRKQGERLVDLPIDEIEIGDLVVVFPHETCPVDGLVVEGHSTMNEAYLTGEPFLLPKAPGAAVLSGAINAEGALTIRAEKKSEDSRYAKIMRVMQESEQRRPKLRRIGDRIGAIYTPLALGIAALAWFASGESRRFLEVLVVATPCPLLIAIPVTILGAVSLAARRGIIIKDPAVLEKIDECRVAIFDKTGTLTYGEPSLVEIDLAPGVDEASLLSAVASLERYSRHPLAQSIVAAATARGLALHEAAEVRERPGEGLRGLVVGRALEITSRNRWLAKQPQAATLLPPIVGGLECVVALDDRYAATLRFRDAPREDGASFIKHLGPSHGFERVLLVSGDRESEVRYLAQAVGITELHAQQSPEQKLALVRAETARAPTVFMGDGINDAPAMTAAVLGIAFGQGSDVTSEAAGAVILESSLQRVDELLHIGRRMRRIAWQSAGGGMALSLVGIGFAAAGLLPPVTGALTQELIDLLAVLNALRAAAAPEVLSDVPRPSPR